ncbi:GH92 family glycosyl hydrolase [uncultured Bacteroides sp.]|uniref:GH92 family glycosyl hydrolase n=1 Tax=uncultured Bacteroides sp. TaxID=162156 RepID=UPI002AA7047C|nr:GH92 family glycosyl hydrolase [uncultured Bacteroides sp.]
MKAVFKLLPLLLLLPGCNQTRIELARNVDPFIGTRGHGHTYPGATQPFGAAQLSPDTRFGNWDACSGYYYNDSTINGFSHTHLSGTGCIDLGDILFRPLAKSSETVSLKDIQQASPFSHKDEKAYPGYYSVILKDGNIKTELTSTTYAGVHRYSFPKGTPKSIVIDLAHSLDNEFIYESDIEKTGINEISGMRRTRGWVDNQYVYFVAQFSQPIQSLTFFDEGKKVLNNTTLKGKNIQVVAGFNSKDNNPIVVKVGLSIVSRENARENLQHDVAGFNFETVSNTSRNEWNKVLSAFQVSGGQQDEIKNFYTALYHTLVVPNIVSDVNGDYRRQDLSIGRLPKDKKQYSTFSIWDTFRTWNPLMTLTDTTLVKNMVNSFLSIYDESGELPIWPLSSGETGTMIGYHSVSVIADAYLKGIRGFDAEKALKAMVASSEKNKKGADYYIKNGFIPSNIKKESVSCLLEFAYDDWTIAQMAKAMGKNDIYETYIKRSQNYMNVFDGYTGFFRGKRLDGNWDTSFNPYEISRNYTEANAWQYRFFVPHDINGLISLLGGKDNFVSALDSLFTTNSPLVGDLVDVSGLVGQYAHGNEPSHHMAYLYNYVGQPWKTQKWVRQLLKEMYHPTPDGISGNEDCGQMSAWYVLSSIGLYPVCPGSNEFNITSPLFEKAVISLANGKKLTILSNNPEKNTYIEKVELNGTVIDKNYVTYNQLMEGGILKFTLCPEPNYKRGYSDNASPYSYTRKSFVSTPYIEKDLDSFLGQIEIKMGSATPGCDIKYTLNGEEPNEQSLNYDDPFVIDKSTEIRAKAYKEGLEPSPTMIIRATKAALDEALNVAPSVHGTSYQYYEGQFNKVSDIALAEVKEKGILAEPSISKALQPDHFAFVFEGLIYVPEDGVYELQTKSDDGSILYVNGKEVVNNDGSHAAIAASGKIALKKGFHSYKLLYFEDYEGESMEWAWKIPHSKVFTSIPKENLYVK